jgi:predicted transcriptional regulator of viral defense system
MVLEVDIMDDKKKVLIFFKNRSDKTITPKELEKGTRLDTNRVRKVLGKLLSEGHIERVSRGKYRFLEPEEQYSYEDIIRYLKTLEKTCQIAYFARKLVWARWEQEYGPGDEVPYDEATFKRAKKIHEWSQYMFALSKKKRNK